MPIVRPINEPFEFVRGDSFPPFSFAVWNDKQKLSLVGSNIVMTISGLSYTKTITQPDIAVVDDVATFDWQTIVNDIPVGVYTYNIKITLSDGFKRTIFSDQFTVK